MYARAPDGTVYSQYGEQHDRCIVLIHGLGLTQHTWQGHIDDLSRSYHVLTYDLYGHGDSAPPPEVPSLSLFAQQLNRLLTHVKVPAAHIIGFSLGGMINRRFALDFPQKTLSLGIFNSPHERAPDAQRLVEERAAQSDVGGPAATIDSTIARWFTPTFIEQRPDYIERIKSWVLANEPKSYAQCRMVLAAGVTELINPTPPIDKPTLVMTCENDSGSTPAMSHAIAAAIAGAQTVVVPQLQHMGLTESPSLFTAPLLLFLDTHV